VPSQFTRQRNPNAGTGARNQRPSAFEVPGICHRAIIIAEGDLMPRIISVVSEFESTPSRKVWPVPMRRCCEFHAASDTTVST
jgi:hypothetical protein